MFYELNKKLQEACEDGDLAKVKTLLQMGANPLGSGNEAYPQECVLSELFFDMLDRAPWIEKMPQYIQLFFDYDMHIEKIPEDPDIEHPLEVLSYCRNENGLKMLQTLLENQLACEAVEFFVWRMLVDIAMHDGCDVEDHDFLENIISGLKMIMLAASYPYIMWKSARIRNWIETRNNDVSKLEGFRNWNDFNYHIDISTGVNVPHGLQEATVIIEDIKTKEIVWKFQI